MIKNKINSINLYTYFLHQIHQKQSTKRRIAKKDVITFIV